MSELPGAPNDRSRETAVALGLVGRFQSALRHEDRAAIVDAIRYISYTHVNQFDTETILRELQPKYYVKGKDWEGRLPSEQVKICGEYAIQVVYLNTVLDSSTRILNEVIKQLSQR